MAISEVELRHRLAAGQVCHGVWSALPGAVTGELLARTGVDFVVVDLQHGALAEAELPGVAAAISAAGAVPLVRTRSPFFADVGRPLDLGARGVIVPNVRDADHAREIVAACRYAPAGGRPIGRLSGGAAAPPRGGVPPPLRVPPGGRPVDRATLGRRRRAVRGRHGGGRDRARRPR